MTQPGMYINKHNQLYICDKFGDFALKNEPRNTKRAQLVKWSIMCIFNEAEPP